MDDIVDFDFHMGTINNKEDIVEINMDLDYIDIEKEELHFINYFI